MGIDVKECSDGTSSSQCEILVRVSDIRRVLKKDDASKSKGEFYFCHYIIQLTKAKLFCEPTFFIIIFTYLKYISGVLSPGVPGVPGVPWHPQILADQLTLSQPGGKIMPT